MKDINEVYITQSLLSKLQEPDIIQDLGLRLQVENALNHYNEQYTKAKALSGIKAIQSFYDIIDEEIKNEDIETTSKFSCKKGCSSCCKMNVTISKDEATYIAGYCKKNNIKISKKYLKKQLQVSEKEIGFSPVASCVFLKNKICTIYDARPFVCRSHYVISDPDLCNIPKHPHITIPIYFNINVQAMISGVWNNSPIDRMPKLLLPYSK